LIDRIRVAGHLRSPYTTLSAKVTGTYCRRPRNVVYGGHTWQEEKSLDHVNGNTTESFRGQSVVWKIELVLLTMRVSAVYIHIWQTIICLSAISG
jgi:hypothetical protein